MEISPDTKDWTWVLDEACPECGFDTRAPTRAELPSIADALGQRWRVAVEQSDYPRARPEPHVWSPLEYACHVRDVLSLADYRVRLMLDEEDPLFSNWDQDEAAIVEDYRSQDPSAAVAGIEAGASAFATTLRAVTENQWARTGRRGDGAAFTVESFTRYLLHDPIHHLTDVSRRRWDASS